MNFILKTFTFILLFSLKGYSQDFKLLYKLYPPKSSGVQNYSNSTYGTGDFIKLANNSLFIKSYLDTSFHWHTLNHSDIIFRQKIRPNDDVNTSSFAEDIAVSQNYLAIADRRGNDNGYVYDYRGKIYLYKKYQNEWKLYQTLSSPNGKGDNFGDNLQINDSLLIVSASGRWKANGTTDDNAIRRPLIYQLNAKGNWILADRLPKTSYDTLSVQLPLLLKDNSIISGVGKTLSFFNIKNGKLHLSQKIDNSQLQIFNHLLTSDNNYFVGVSSMSANFQSHKVVVFEKVKDKWQLHQTLEIPYKDQISSIGIDNGFLALGLSRNNSILSIDPIPGKVLIFKLNRQQNKWALKQTIIPKDSYAGDLFGEFLILREVKNYNTTLKFFQDKGDTAAIKKMRKNGQIYVYGL